MIVLALAMMASGAGSSLPPAVASLIRREKVLDEACRGDPNGNDNGKCERRDAVAQELQRRGWCWGPDAAEDEAHRRWMRCGKTATPGY